MLTSTQKVYFPDEIMKLIVPLNTRIFIRKLIDSILLLIRHFAVPIPSGNSAHRYLRRLFYYRGDQSFLYSRW